MGPRRLQPYQNTYSLKEACFPLRVFSNKNRGFVWDIQGQRLKTAKVDEPQGLNHSLVFPGYLTSSIRKSHFTLEIVTA